MSYNRDYRVRTYLLTEYLKKNEIGHLPCIFKHRNVDFAFKFLPLLTDYITHSTYAYYTSYLESILVLI